MVPCIGIQKFGDNQKKKSQTECAYTLFAGLRLLPFDCHYWQCVFAYFKHWMYTEIIQNSYSEYFDGNLLFAIIVLISQIFFFSFVFLFCVLLMIFFINMQHKECDFCVFVNFMVFDIFCNYYIKLPYIGVYLKIMM